MIESWGRGIYKIINECEKAHVPVSAYEFYWGGMEVHFTAVKGSEENEKTSVKMTVKTSVKTLELIKANPEITRPELDKGIDKSIRSVE